MNLKFLVPLAWTLWTILLGVAIYGLVMVAQDTRRSPEAGPGLGYFAVAFVFIVLIAAGGILYRFAKKQSQSGVMTMVGIFGFLVFGLVADPAMKVYKQWSFEQDEARVGDFRDPVLKEMATAIRSGDCVTLKRLLAGRPAPAGKDRAGHDVLAYSLVVLRDRKGSAECVRTLLEAGTDPRVSRMPDGSDLLHFMIVDRSPPAQEAVLSLLQYEADPNAVDPVTHDTPIRGAGDSPRVVRALVEAGADIDRIQPDGVTALVYYVSVRQWESARYLVERGARLDVKNEHGLSLDYYLKDWKESVFGDHPEGWDRLREAIAARGKVIP